MAAGGVEFGSVARLVEALGVLSVGTREALRPALVAAGDIVAEQTRENAAFSSRIPGAVYVKAPLTARSPVVVGINAILAPEAKPLEVGNVGSRSSTSFRHPVFGRDDWVAQDMHQSLFPAVRDKTPEVTTAVAGAVAAFVASTGFVLT